MQTISLVPEECTDDYLVFAASEPHSPDGSAATDTLAEASVDSEDTTAPAHFRLPLTADTRSALQRLLGDTADAADVSDSADSTSTDTATPEAAPQSDGSDASHAGNGSAVDNDKDADDHAAADTTGLDTAGSEQSESLMAPSTPTVVLTPREIQARIRGGKSIEDLARASGMSQGRIEPFAHPILAERKRMTTVARV